MKKGNKDNIPALLGGKPLLEKPLSEVHNIGEEEISNVLKILKTGPLSGFLASAGKKFSGGENVLKLEKSFSKKFSVKHALTFNSATTALHGAIVALGIGPGDEVILPPYTMSASATTILANGAVPIFADIDPETFCIDPKSVRERISPYTKAIMSVNLFGQSADYDELLVIAKEHNLKIIEDNAQAPGAKYNGKYTGTIGDIGVFSFNVHKTIQAGEGGILVTNNDGYALRASLCRNHGEVVVDDMSDYNLGPIIGSNYRMTEVVAGIMAGQINKLETLNQKRIDLADYLRSQLVDIPGIIPPYIDPNSTHVYYRFVFKIDEKKLGISRDTFVDAMIAEGFNLSKGYVKPIYLLPVFQEKKVFNNTQFPFVYEGYGGNPEYGKGMCPVVEKLYESECTLTDVCQHPYTKKHINLFIEAIHKILSYKKEL